MASVRSTSLDAPSSGPAWEIARLFPEQGHLSESDYLLVTERTRQLVEFTDGCIEVLPTPTLEHQEIVLFLVNLLRAFVQPAKLGRAVTVSYTHLDVYKRQGQCTGPRQSARQ